MVILLATTTKEKHVAKTYRNLKDSWTLIDGLPVRYRESNRPYPENSPTLVHLHGFAISGRYMLPTADKLAADYQTFVPDLPGFGESEEPDPDLGISDLADATIAFMDEMGIEKATLVGNSMGCITSLEASRKYPDRVERLVLCSPAGGPFNQPLPKGLFQLARDGFHEPISLWPIAVTDYLRFGLIDVFRLFRDMIAYPSVEQFRSLEIPTLVVKGEHDPLVSEENALSQAAPNDLISVVRLNGAAHAVNFSHPDELANIIRRFINNELIADDPGAKGETVPLKRGVVVREKNIAEG